MGEGTWSFSSQEGGRDEIWQVWFLFRNTEDESKEAVIAGVIHLVLVSKVNFSFEECEHAGRLEVLVIVVVK